MTDHPCKGIPKAQREAFERIATNQPPGCTWPTIDALMKRGLVERGQGETRRDAMGVYEIPNFYVPLAVHAQWCAWCSESVPVQQREAMEKKMKKLPKEVLIYQCDEADGEPVYAVARNVDEIPEDADGEKVGIYVLNHENNFRIRRELKP